MTPANLWKLRRDLALRFAAEGNIDDFCGLVGFDPNEAQSAILHSKARRIVARFGRRSGKTVAAAVKAAFETCKLRTTGWIIAPRHELTGRAWNYYERIMCGKSAVHPTMPNMVGLGLRPTVSRRSAPLTMEFDWGSKTVAHTTQGSGATSLEGESLNWAIWDECAQSDDVWETHLMPNLSDQQGWCLFISKPWGHNHFEDKWYRGDAHSPSYHQAWESFHYTTEVNFSRQPNLRGDFLEAQATWTPETFAQEWLAEFTTFAGQVYKEFKRELHVPVRTMEYDPSLPLYLSFDFGTTNPFVCLWIQTTADDTVRILDEYYQTGRDTTTNGEAVLDYHARGGQCAREGYGEPTFFSADPSGRDQILTLQKQVGIKARYREMSRQRKEVAWGIDTIRRLLLPRPGYNGNPGPPSLFVNRHCENTIREFENYRYPEVKADQPGKEEPRKLDDHTMDSLRYWVACWYARGAESREVQRRLVEAVRAPVVRPALERLMEKHQRMLAGGR